MKRYAIYLTFIGWPIKPGKRMKVSVGDTFSKNDAIRTARDIIFRDEYDNVETAEVVEVTDQAGQENSIVYRMGREQAAR